VMQSPAMLSRPHPPPSDDLQPTEVLSIQKTHTDNLQHTK